MANASLLEHAHQLHLKIGRHVHDFIEKDCAAIGRAEKAFGVADGSSEGALLVAEQLAFDQIFRQRTAVQRHKWSIGILKGPHAESIVMNATRHEFLTGSALARDEYGGPIAACCGHLFLDGLHDSAFADDVLKTVSALKLGPKAIDFFLQLFLLDGAPDEQIQLIVVERLLNVMRGS